MRQDRLPDIPNASSKLIAELASSKPDVLMWQNIREVLIMGYQTKPQLSAWN